MNRNLVAFSLWLFCISIGGFSQSLVWNQVFSGSFTGSLQDVFFHNRELGWIAGDSGLIYKTNNGGASWARFQTPSLEKLNKIQFFNPQVGIAVGNQGVILRSADGGATWQLVSSVTQNNLTDFHFADQNNGWAVGWNGTILRTTNAGLNWQTLTSGTTFNFFSVHFGNSEVGLAVGHAGNIFKTTNGGLTWEPKNSGTTNWLKQVQFFSESVAYALSSNGLVYWSNDGGETWLLNSDLGTIQNNRFFFKNYGIALSIGEQGKISFRSSAVALWASITSGTSRSLQAVYMVDSEYGWIVGAQGTILKTTNGGTVWQCLSCYSFKAVHFAGPQLGWAVGDAGRIMATTNSGMSWNMQASGTSALLTDVFFVNKYLGWITGYDGSMLKTTNGGQSWHNNSILNTLNFNSIYFTSEEIGFAVGQSGIFMKTSDGGTNWTSQNLGIIGAINSIFFINPQTGWIVGQNGIVRKTTNGGSTWANLDLGTSDVLNDVRFVNEQVGFMVGGYARMYKTTNGGLTWQLQNSGISLSHNLMGVAASDTLNAVAVGTFDCIYRTTNGGTSWNLENIGGGSTLEDVYLFGPTEGWAVGSLGKILTTLLQPINWNFTNKSSLVTGIITKRTDNACTPIPSSPRFPGAIVKALPGPYYAMSNGNGEFGIRLPISSGNSSSYTLAALPVQTNAILATPICPEAQQYSVSLDTIPDTLTGRDFAYRWAECHFLEVQLVSNRRRRCFLNNTTVSYSNLGMAPALNAHILVQFPHWVRPVSASQPYQVVNDSTWRFDLGTLIGGQNGRIFIQDSVACGNPDIRNLMQCTRATIYPAPDCLPPGGWNGSEVSVTGQCQNGMVKFGVYNHTSQPMPDSVDYWIYLDSIQVRVGKIKLQAGDSLQFLVQTDGLTAVLSVNQVAGHPNSVFVTSVIENCANTIFLPRQIANYFPKSQTPMSKVHCLPILDSYDPNDKQVFPIGFSAQRIVKPGTELEYLIRFQNTGNDTAYTVYVIDSLDRNLQIESLKLGAISHPYQVSLQTTRWGRSFLRFQFDQINLPDSTTNQPLSHGYIQYRISPRSDLALGSKAKNQAEIFFDFNPAIVTNTTLTTFDNITFTNPVYNNHVQVITSTNSDFSGAATIRLFPNPFAESFTLQSNLDKEIRLNVYNVLGKQVANESLKSGEHFQLKSLPTGLYIFSFPEFNQSIKVRKE